MGKSFFASVLSVLISVATFLHIPGTPKQPVFPSPTPLSASVKMETPTPTASPLATATPTIIYVPTATLSPTDLSAEASAKAETPTPTMDQKAVDACNGMYMPIEVFSGHSCLYEDNNYRWMDSVNGHPATESFMDNAFKGWKSDEVKKMFVNVCLKTTKEHFERCSNSIRDNSGRIVDEMKDRIASDIQNCLNTHSQGGDMQRQFTPRYMAKDRLKGKLYEMYDFCFSHSDSVSDYHP